MCLDDPGGIPLVLVAGSLVKGLTNCNPFVLFGLLCTWFCLFFPSLSPLLFLPFFPFCSILLWCCLSFFFFVLCTWFCLHSTLLSPSFLAFFLLFCFYLIWWCFLFSILFFALQGWGLGFNKPDRGSYRLKVFLLGLAIQCT